MEVIRHVTSNSCGVETIEELNQILVDMAREKKIVRGRKLRLDTTVVDANVHYSTHAGPLADCARVITRTGKRIKNLEPWIKAGFRDRTRSIKKRIYSISRVLKRQTGTACRQGREITREIVDIAETLVRAKLGRFSTKPGKFSPLPAVALSKRLWIPWRPPLKLPKQSSPRPCQDSRKTSISKTG